ncbi:saccharopine dehydrogenase [Bacteriovorax sp. Seq25_V]|uniref:saccharopine dehydrogenase n=1 Tax=Bacteriovorax sp. Seq25_V TaxID=1201288 RepID=UPI00038A07CD|nr:saccharopine dehydrogenase [Bacteriovorax sp. Seq25_V]EQC47359.1 alanine dehydrogenase/PNT, N-terminal domain protein [Bacteriovorax sp. Seq25_V]
MTTIWLRDEVKENEKRTPLTPQNAGKLINAGHQVIVEESIDRIFPIDDYKKIGATIVPSNSWITNAPLDAFILGLKELKEDTFNLTHKHIYFAHIFKGQDGAKDVFERYNKGEGILFDLEFLLQENGRRVAAFGFWAGYVGAALAVENYCHHLKNEPPARLKHYQNKSEWVSLLKTKLDGIKPPTSLIIGALGRCGTGANQLLEDLGLSSTKWDVEETSKGGPFKEILEHDIFVNTVLMTDKINPFLDQDIIKLNTTLKIISDVSCDPNSELNPIPIYSSHTTWDDPIINAFESDISIIAIDNLPSALPKESSEDFSDQLFPHLLNLCNEGLNNYTWRHAKEIFDKKRAL